MSKKEKVTRVTYYSYHIEDTQKKERYLYNINDFLQKFCSINKIKYKKSFTYNDEHYYLVPISLKNKSQNNFYYFISTKNNDIGKVIEESKNIQVSDIEAKLNQNQMLGFASYVMVQDTYISFSASNISPKFASFAAFINSIFESLKINNKYKFILKSFPLEITANEALNLSFIGRTSLKIKSTSQIGINLFKLLSTKSSSNNIDGYEIIIKPKRKQDVTEFGKEVLTLAMKENHSDIQSVSLKAKMNLTDDMQEYIIFTNSKLSDTIRSSNDEERCKQMLDKALKNNNLKDMLNEVNQNFKNKTFKGLDSFTANINNWYSAIN